MPVQNKLLLYADGACRYDGPDGGVTSGSFAAYLVPRKSKWRNREEEHLVLKEHGHPLIHQGRMSVGVTKTERGTNILAEAKMLETALVWARNYIKSQKDDVAEVEVCVDCQAVERQLKGYRPTHNRPLKKVLQRIRRIILDIDLPVRITWIPGVLMKQTIIAH